MISFENDYAQGAHPRIIEALARTNEEHSQTYCNDEHCLNAAGYIRQKLGKECFVTFMPGGTIANLTVISHFLRPYQAVVSADTGHIFANETGAIEATGHRVIALPTSQGKLTPRLIQAALDDLTNTPHVVQLKLVYISHPTELGTLYSKEELVALSSFCREKGLYLFADGARLACALAAQKDKLTMADLAELTDAFTIGGTKCGALFGDAVVIPNSERAQDFMFSVKQKGGLMARSRVLGIQFEELMRDDLYTQLGEHANQMAGLLRDELASAGFEFYATSPTNQQFVYIENKALEKLSQKYMLRVWKAEPQRSLVRLVTSWATKKDDVLKFIGDAKTGAR